MYIILATPWMNNLLCLRDLIRLIHWLSSGDQDRITNWGSNSRQLRLAYAISGVRYAHDCAPGAANCGSRRPGRTTRGATRLSKLAQLPVSEDAGRGLAIGARSSRITRRVPATANLAAANATEGRRFWWNRPQEPFKQPEDSLLLFWLEQFYWEVSSMVWVSFKIMLQVRIMTS